jgi:hypothetical protein
VDLEVCRAVLHFLNGFKMDEKINVMHSVLIPKKTIHSYVSDFMPISLCNVIYKLISKILVNRLKIILPHVISANQSAFILDRLISDNIVTAYETLHSKHTKMWSKVGYMGIKIDMSKTYGKVEWVFLEAIMRKMEFSEVWVKLIMECVSSVSYSILVNGQSVGNINLS